MGIQDTRFAYLYPPPYVAGSPQNRPFSYLRVGIYDGMRTNYYIFPYTALRMDDCCRMNSRKSCPGRSMLIKLFKSNLKSLGRFIVNQEIAMSIQTYFWCDKY